MSVDDVKQLESELAAAREAARAGYLKEIEENLSRLRAIGFDYRLETAKKLGRPKKGGAGGEEKAGAQAKN